MPEVTSKNKRRDDLKKIAEDILVSYDARTQFVDKIVKDTHELLDVFRRKREGMSANLREILAKFESLRKKDFNVMMQDILMTQYKREENIKKMFADFQEEETGVAQRLKNLLKKGETIRLTDFKKTLNHIRQDQTAREASIGGEIRIELAAMQNEVCQMLEAFKKEREAASSEWAEIRNLLAKKDKNNQ